ncbi:MAG TPA: hypothetical protein DD723_06000 [Candidatus Omnitrophica bacterium]|nr:MAG: hypothetical protein A2Z81_06775 [Omnitrophica WOR_2 bacterium GWA2_45_18]HBR15077.1 hypothetical protein [Candidatus Omnitrophota bacterium]
MKITRGVLSQIIAHARKEAPLEACGYLAREDGIVHRHYALTNMDHSAEHFSFDPQEQFAALKDARASGYELCAVYHSHPASPARPSAEDIKLAYDPTISYVIISLAGGKEDVQSYKIVNAVVEHEKIEIMD